MDKIDVFYIGPFTASGGVATFSDTISSLKSNRFNIIPHNTFVLKNESYGSKLFIFQNTLNFILYFMKMLLKRDFYTTNIFHISVTSNMGFYEKSALFYFLKVFNKKVIFHVHGGGFKEFYKRSKYQNFIRKVLHKVDLVIVLSDEWKRVFEKELNIRNEIIVLQNTVKVPNLDYRDRGSKNIFLFMGNLVQEKGLTDLLNLISEHEEWMIEHNCTFIICGKGPLESEIKKRNLPCVQFEGLVNGQKKDTVFKKSDCLILPSYIEGLPYVVLEAMSYGHYILSTTVGAIPEVIKTSKNGLLSEPGDKKVLFKHIKQYILIDKKESFVANRHIISEMYSENYLKRKLIEIYEANK